MPGESYSYAYGISADGTVVVGTSQKAFRWTKANGMADIGYLAGNFSQGYAHGVSADGSVIVGYNPSLNGGSEAFCWNNGIMTGIDYDYAYAVSANGFAIVGKTSTDGQAFRWDNGVVAVLGDFSISSTAWAVSANGLVVAGSGTSSGMMGTEAFRWENGVMTGLGYLPNSTVSSALGISADGAVIVGKSGDQAFQWKDGVMTGLGYLSLGSSIAFDASADGSIIVGAANIMLDDDDSDNRQAFIWNARDGMISLQEMLTNRYGLDLDGWTLKWATGISDDGRTIVGYGFNPNGQREAWIAEIPEPATILLLSLGTLILSLNSRKSKNKRRIYGN